MRHIDSFRASIFVTIVVIVICALLSIDGGTGLVHDRSLSRHRAEKFVEFDTDDPRAMEDWARGVCRGQQISVLAAFYKVKDTPETVAAAIARDLPHEARRIVTKVCEAELRKLQNERT